MGSIDQGIAAIVCFSLIVLFVILVAVTIMLWRKLNSVKRKYDAMIGHTGVANLEELITELQHKMSTVQGNLSDHERSIQQMKSKMSEMKGNVSIQRFNAFSESGSDQSFSIAFIDDHLDGVVLTVIHSREESYSYGKPLVKGESKYALSPEERQVINSALSKSQNHV